MITANSYYNCTYCGVRGCKGCKLPYNDELFVNYVKYDPDSYYKNKSYDM